MADYAFRTIEDRRKIQEMWEEGKIAARDRGGL